jgi:probable phosphoglycerate mutase
LIIYLVRHGETEWNVARRLQGHLDSPLTATGIAQAQAVGRLLRAEIAAGRTIQIEASHLGRARRTAEIVAAAVGVQAADVIATPLLAEHDLGAWSGLTIVERDNHFPTARADREVDKWNYLVPDGESYATAHQRAERWFGSTRDGDVVIAVTHEMFSRNLQGVYLSLPPEQMLARSHRQDVAYRLADGRIEELRAT